ncbi:MAG: hypothetical protein HKN43_06090 [Rhodothermales bacterium]|nr:hypothetical protein [Rhodothermales bacterium]
MIAFKSVRPLSNRFSLSGLSQPAYVKLNGFTEQGFIDVDGKRYNVEKYGPASGFWTVEHNGLVVLSAEKNSALKRTFEIRNQSDLLTITASSPFTRSFSLIRDGKNIGRIKPNHPLTRKGTINLEVSIDSLTLAFAFWLCAMSWRRAHG